MKQFLKNIMAWILIAFLAGISATLGSRLIQYLYPEKKPEITITHKWETPKNIFIYKDKRK